MIRMIKIKKRLGCKFGFHRWESCIKLRPSPFEPRRYERCFPCGKERE